MKKKLIAIIAIIVLGIIIISIIVFIKNLQEESKNTKKLMNEISEYYEKLEESITEYNNHRENLNQENTSYYQDTFKEDYDKMLDNLKSYDETITNLTIIINILNKDCSNNKFSDPKITNICNIYKQTYEEMINIYINDVNNFNKIVDTYNKETSSKLETFTTNNTLSYIDYDEDGEYLGKK